jgi:predicted phosphodiesterase
VRTALISDIHANLEALEAVLAHIDGQRVDRIVCLGDIIGYGPDPVACVDIVAKRCEFALMGNHDFAALYEPTNFNQVAEQAAYWTRFQLESEASPDEARRRWSFLNGLRVRVARDRDFAEPTAADPTGRYPYLCVHGSPRRPINEYIFPDDGDRSQTKMASIFDRFDHVCLVGHTHWPGVFTETSAGEGDDLVYEFYRPTELEGARYQIRAGTKVIVNPGSVGQPRDGIVDASYAILDTDASREGIVEFHRLPYDVQTTVDKIKRIPEINHLLGERLLQGK